MSSSSRVRIGIVGVGNCASSLIQGLQFYGTAGAPVTGLTNPLCAGFSVADVEIASAFDVDEAKIGRDVSEAIWQAPKSAVKVADVPALGVRVREGILGEGIGSSTPRTIRSRGGSSVDGIAAHLEATDTAIVVNFLPVGSQQATEFYAQAALAAGCGFLNCTPAHLARNDGWRRRFLNSCLPLVGDDLKSLAGSPSRHAALDNSLGVAGQVLDAVRYTKRAMARGTPEDAAAIAALLMNEPGQLVDPAAALRVLKGE